MAAPTPKTGDRVLTLANTAVATKLGSPQFQVRGGLSFVISTEWQADSVAGGNTVSMKIEWFSDKGTLLSTQTLFNKVADAVDTWERFCGPAEAPATARWGKITLEKAANTFNAYFDRVAFDVDQSESLDVFLGTTHDLGIFDMVFTIIELDTENFDRGDNFNTTAWTYTVSAPGFYQVRATARIGRDPTEGLVIEARVRVRLNGSSTIVQGIVTGGITTFLDVDSGEGVATLAAGDLLTVEGWGDTTGVTSPATAIQGDGLTNFFVSKIA